jgi:hypothetical protein
MKEYIDREATLNERPEGRNPGQVGKEEYNKGWNDCRSAFYRCISGMPAADVAEVRHGRWERVSTASGIISRVRCSVCAGTQPLTFENMPYCPTCGARMDEEDEHEAD